jgi:hypothetical protein
MLIMSSAIGTQKHIAIVRVADLCVGDQVAESDGFLFDIIAITPSASGKTVTFTLASEFSSFKSHWAQNGGVKKAFRANSRLWAVRA